jgi:hemolysin activation/secretion protein
LEGVLSGVVVETDGRFRPDYFRDRLIARSPAVVNVQQLEEQLQLFLLDPRVRRIDAEFVPGKVRGEGTLHAHIEEEDPTWSELQLINDVSPSIGGVAARPRFNYANPLRRGDWLEMSAALSHGLKEVDILYELPLTLSDTLLELEAELSDVEVVEQPFKPLDIEGRAQSYTIGLRQPFYRSLSTTIAAFLRGEYRKRSSFLFGEPFSFSQGTEDGVARVYVIRGGVDWSYRDQWQVLALRTHVSFGLDAFGATRNPENIPDGEFITWLGQVQWARRLGFLDSQLLLRLDAQLSDSPLLTMEQFTIGGVSTVRGYRENERLTDNGVVGSMEWRVPLTRLANTFGRLEIASFIDAGKAWNHDRSSMSPQTLVGVGLGLRWRYRERAWAYLYWANSLRETSRISENDLQDDGIHFGMSLGWK